MGRKAATLGSFVDLGPPSNAPSLLGSPWVMRLWLRLALRIFVPDDDDSLRKKLLEMTLTALDRTNQSRLRCLTLRLRFRTYITQSLEDMIWVCNGE